MARATVDQEKYRVEERGAAGARTLEELAGEARAYRSVVPATRVVQQQVDLAPDAQLHRAVATVTASPGSAVLQTTTPESVAGLRVANPRSSDRVAAIIDFGGIVTVGGLLMQGIGDDDVEAVCAWTGSSWRRLAGSGQFPETATERLLVEAAATFSAHELLTAIRAGSLVLPAMPTFLELLVDGTTVWFERQGSSADLAVPAIEGAAVYRIDRTVEIRQALARSIDSGGPRSVMVVLRSVTPGLLDLDIEVEVLHEHPVVFPVDGAVHTVEIGEESELGFDVTPPPPTAEAREVAVTVRGAFGPERVVPPLGPELVDEAAVVLVPERPVLLGLPGALASRLDRLTALRVHLAVAEGAGAEVTGRLLENADVGGSGRPGGPVKGGELSPCNVSAGTSGWVSVALAEPLALGEFSSNGVVAVWLELVATYGEAEIALTEASVVVPPPTGGPPSELDAPGAALLRRLPGGGTAAYTLVPALGSLQAALRLVGVPSSEQPLPAVIFAVAGTPAWVGVSPTGTDTSVRLTLPEPSVSHGRLPVTLRAVVGSPGSLTLDRLRVTYYDGGGTGEAP